jgi:cytochrome P450
VDLIATFAAPLPALVIGRMSGVPEEDLGLVRAYSDDYIFAKVHAGTEEADAASARCLRFDDHLREVIRSRRESGQRPDDLLTTLIECRDDAGTPISDERILTHLSKDVLIGGIETTTHFIGNLLFQILSQEGLYERLRQDRSWCPRPWRSRCGTWPRCRWSSARPPPTPRWAAARSRPARWSSWDWRRGAATPPCARTPRSST